MDESIERWLPVVGYEGLYEVSSQGRVRSFKQDPQGRLLSGARKDPAGYRTVTLYSPNSYGDGFKRIYRRVHVLVAEAFLGPRPDGDDVRHLDDDKLNNFLSNLAYGTRSENVRDGIRNGKNRWVTMTHCLRGHELTPDNVYVRSDGKYPARRCRTCIKIWNQTSRERANGEGQL